MYSKINIKSNDLKCAEEISKELGMDLEDFISLLIDDAAKTILTPILPSLCQIINARRLSSDLSKNNKILLEKSEETGSFL